MTPEDYGHRVNGGEPSFTNERAMHHFRLGKLPAKASRDALHFADFAEAPAAPLPKATNFWTRRAGFSLDTYGNTQHGCCTIASQAHLARRMERLEQRATIDYAADEILRVYYAMTARLYGGGDTGAYEEDALNNWRNPDTAFRDAKGHPYVIDAYVRVNQRNQDEVRRALAASAAHGIKVCFNLPAMWASVAPPLPWDVRRGADGAVDLGGLATPGSWGGHSMFARDYDERGVWVGHTWGIPDQVVTWDAMAAYCDEAFVVIDKVDAWKRRRAALRLDALREAVNAVSGVKIA